MAKKKVNKKLISTKLPVAQYQVLEAYAQEKDMSVYEAASELLSHALVVRTGQTDDIQTRLNMLKEELKQELNSSVKEEMLKYLKRILYHCFRIDAWEFEYTRRVHNDKLADELNQDIEELVNQHSKS